MLPKGILFDLDDTLIAFDAVANPAWQQLCDTYARRAALDHPMQLSNTIQAVRTWYWSDPVRHKWARHHLSEARRQIVQRAFETLGIEDLALAHDMADTYTVEREALIHLFPGAVATLHDLRDRQVALALIPNGAAQQQRQKVERFGLERFFTTILIEGELGYGKPEEAIYRRALEHLGLAPDEVWSVGDHLEWDVSAPQRLGIFGVWHNVRGQGLPPASPVIPDRTISRITELMM